MSCGNWRVGLGIRVLGVGLGIAGVAWGQPVNRSSPPLPPPPPDLRLQPGASATVRTANQPPAPPVPRPAQVPPAFRPIPQPAGLPQTQGVPLLPAGPLPPLAPNVLAWDADAKEYRAKPGEMTAHLSFGVTNISGDEVVISYVRTSCGCTVAKLPSQPWKLAPGDFGAIPFTVDLRGKIGLLTKVASIETSKGFKSLTLKVNIPVLPSAVTSANDRLRNMQVASADRQAVFKNDCAKCHAEPAGDKTGEALFKAVCAVCHKAEHRASMVPDLHTLTTPTGPDHWRTWITSGKVGSLMPAFAKAEGGILTDGQIRSLVEHLTATIPKAGGATPASAVPPPPNSGAK